MKALNKLYVEITNGRWIGRTSDVPQSEDSVEYIRKDYLLEWAKGEQNKCSDETHPYAMFMNVVIDKLNEI